METSPRLPRPRGCREAAGQAARGGQPTVGGAGWCLPAKQVLFLLQKESRFVKTFEKLACPSSLPGREELPGAEGLQHRAEQTA